MMTEEQSEDIKRIYGESEIIQYDSTVTDIDDILKYKADVYAVFLPLNLISELMKKTDAIIIQPVSGRVSTGGQVFNKAAGKMETEYAYKHLYWQKIIKIEVITEKL